MRFHATTTFLSTDIIHVLLKLKPAGLMLMAANGAHEHEWKVFEDVKLPDGKYLVPGVIDSTTNIIEHPEVVAQRLVRYANVVGRENVMAGTDCGFGTAAGMQIVAPSIAWAKLQAMGQGAQLASQRAVVALVVYLKRSASAVSLATYAGQS